jgi:hypothetical protein
MFQSYDHLQQKIYMSEITLLTTDSLFLDINVMDDIVDKF